MYELVRTQLYLNMVHGVVIYYQLHVILLYLVQIALGTLDPYTTLRLLYYTSSQVPTPHRGHK